MPTNETIETKVAVLETRLNAYMADIAEIKSSVKETSRKIDDLALDFQKFGGLYNTFQLMNERINSLEGWHIENKEFVSNLKNLHSDNTKRFWDALWEFAKLAIATASGILAGWFFKK